ncbi:transcriptional regulator [Salicibibacter halophilus]|uniref:Transcriptional regulator n=1 Tax=Salicibibacter halophilus TaxID=2502791 RepID=A0A514LKG8_9BACI|nr:helix-turn-helix domain-containing protein [Salicibibacter halophilus]QDI92035.1 transcriptional regulator [Salicibibacter halophilus]
MKKNYNLPCNIAQTLNIVGDRWTLLILHELMVGHTTFNEIKRYLEGISSNLLSDRLKYLEEEDLVASTLYSTHPPRFEYALTESGKDLEPVFHSLLLWGRKNLDPCYKKLVDTTGDEVEIRYFNPQTNQLVGSDDLSVITMDEKVGESY